MFQRYNARHPAAIRKVSKDSKASNEETLVLDEEGVKEEETKILEEDEEEDRLELDKLIKKGSSKKKKSKSKSQPKTKKSTKK